MYAGGCAYACPYATARVRGCACARMCVRLLAGVRACARVRIYACMIIILFHYIYAGAVCAYVCGYVCAGVYVRTCMRTYNAHVSAGACAYVSARM